MNRKVKKQWLKALRSGDYPQGEGCLVKQSEGEDISDSFCCLGVLGDLFVDSPEGQAMGAHWADDISPGDVHLVIGDGSSSGFLPPAVQGWAGLDDQDPCYMSRKRVFSLSALNDDGLSFKQIANRIEKHF